MSTPEFDDQPSSLPAPFQHCSECDTDHHYACLRVKQDPLTKTFQVTGGTVGRLVCPGCRRAMRERGTLTD